MTAISGDTLSDFKLNPSILEAALKICANEGQNPAASLILIDTAKQVCFFIKDNKDILFTYPVSTAALGTGQVENSYQTPLGLHKIKEKIGQGAQPFEVFSSRVSQGTVCTSDDPPSIVGRILRLEGLEKGYNQGKNSEGQCVDSWERYIYIHGTNKIDEIGRAAGAGCIRMKPEDIIQLFDQVSEGTIVYIG